MRKLAISGLVVAAAVAAVAISVATSQAKWHILSETAINTQRLCRDGLTYTWASGQTDVQPPATRPVGQPRWVGPVDLLIQSGPSTLPQDEADWENQPMEGGNVFTAGYAPVKNPTTSLARRERKNEPCAQSCMSTNVRTSSPATSTEMRSAAINDHDRTVWTAHIPVASSPSVVAS